MVNPPFRPETLRALLDRLIPADDFPGAVEAGVENYLARQWAGDCASEAEACAASLLQLDTESGHRHGGRYFGQLSPSQQDKVLHDLESGKAVTVWSSRMPAAKFLERMVQLAHEGFYSDPGNGGNRDEVSWKMIRYEPRGTEVTPRPGEPTPGPGNRPASREGTLG